MKLIRFQSGGRTGNGIVIGEEVIEIDANAGLGSSMQAIIAGGQDSLAMLQEMARQPTTHRLANLRLLAPIDHVGKYLAIGMNYRKHLAEADNMGIARSDHQVWFNKQTTCISGPYDDIDPGVTGRLDYEVELGIVIGAKAKHVPATEAIKHVFGYFVANDVSARDWQFHSQTFTMGKSFDTHGPIGPWIVTSDEIADPHNLSLRCFVNGELRQESNTGLMIANIWDQIAYLSTAFTLEPGDLLATGTPEGVGISMSPPRLLRPGDIVRCEVEGIGAIENRVRARAA